MPFTDLKGGKEKVEENKEKNKMGTMKINKLMLTMGAPMILSMVLQAVYNIVDSAFVSNMHDNGEAALNALTLAFPVQMMMVAIAIGTGVGMNALLSKNLGSGNLKKASKVAGNTIFLGVIIYIVFLVFGIFGANFYVSTQTNNLLIKNMAVEYLKICCILSVGIVFFSIFEKMLQATGRSVYSTIALISGAVTNMILDPILIYGLLGVPEMGVAGAAYATVIGQVVSFLVAIIFHVKFNKEIKGMMKNGLNIILVRISETAVTAYGLYYKIQQFILFAAFGLRDAITPIVSFNHGMRSKERVKKGIKYGLIYTLIIMIAGTVVLEIFANPFSKVFGLSGETQQLCVSAIRVISISFVFAGANIAFQGIFQALEGGMESLLISICRQFLFVLPVAWGFSLIATKDISYIWLVWMTFPIAEALSCIIACVFMKKIDKKKIQSLKNK